MLFSGVLNSRLNSFQLGGHDTNQLDKEIINDTTNTSQLSQSSQHPKQVYKDLSRRRTG